MNSKVQTYIGFAIKKGSVVYGCDAIEKYRKKMFLLLYTQTLSANSLAILNAVATQRNLPVKQIDDYSVLTNKNCKALAICDKSLANAILENLM